jgi:oligoendopeptidase F
MYLADPQNFAPRYVALMKNGFDAPPADLLRRFPGLDLHDPDLLTKALRIVEGRVKLLEGAYQE